MRYTANHKAETRARILQQASVTLRRSGSENIAIAELMKESGLTHGGFYAHFKSRDALIEETFRDAMEGIARRWRARADNAAAGKKLEAIVNGYLTIKHRDDVDGGCVFPAMGSEIARANVRTRRTFTAKFKEMIDLVAQHQSGKLTRAARKRAAATVVTMFGSLLLARAVEDEDLSLDILDGGREAALNTSPRKRASGTSRTKKAKRVVKTSRARIPKGRRAAD